MDEQKKKDAYNSRSYHQMMVDELNRDIEADNLRLLEMQYSQRISELENKERIVQTIIEMHKKNKNINEVNKSMSVKYTFGLVAMIISLFVMYLSK